MANFWEDLKNNITEWSIVASEKAEEFTHTSKLRVDVLQLERKLSSLYVKLGLYVFSKTKEKNVLNFLNEHFLGHHCTMYFDKSIDQGIFISDLNILIRELTKQQ